MSEPLDPLDPFREGLPDFEDPALDFFRDGIVRGVENMRALFDTSDIGELMTAVQTLDDQDARVTLAVVVMAWRISINGERDFVTRASRGGDT